MMRFNVWDKVIVARRGETWNVDGEMDKWLGRVMTINYKDEDSYQMEEDENENNGEGWWWSDEDLEPAEFAIQVTKLGGKMVAKNLISGEKAEVKCGDDLNRSARLAMEKLSEKEIHVGDIVKVVNGGALYTTYPEWVAENVDDKVKIAMYAYGKDVDTSKTYRVLAIAPHQTYRSDTLAYIEEVRSWGNTNCFVIGMYGIQKV